MTKIDAEQMTRYYKALTFAIRSHDGQHDKAGEPYILHPLEVANSLQFESERIYAQMAVADDIRELPKSYPMSDYLLEEAVIVALLHDVVEDTDYTIDDIKKLDFEPDAEAIDCLTRKKDETYREFIERICTNMLATKVKIADMEHNLSRIDKLPESERRLADRYNKWLPVLKQRWIDFNTGVAKEDEDIIAGYIGLVITISNLSHNAADYGADVVEENVREQITEQYGKETLDSLDNFIAGIDKEEIKRIFNKRHIGDDLESLAEKFKVRAGLK